MKLTQICVVIFFGLVQLARSVVSGLRGTTDFGKALLKELEEDLGSVYHRKQTEQQVPEFESELTTTFKALPKNDRGALEGPHARYALHRLFHKRYGWQVKGLEMTSGAWYEGMGDDIMGDRLPRKMRELFEKQLGIQGLSLEELAVLAAALNAMFRHDVYDRLHVVYKAFNQSITDILSVDKAVRIGHAYMATLILGNMVEKLQANDVLVSDSALQGLEGHQDTENLLSATMMQVAGANPRSFEWELMTSWLLAFGQKLGHKEDHECKRMKGRLVFMESGTGTGRVRISDFHRASDTFEESLSDLRGMEALDETDPDDPKVIISNYLQGSSNCINPASHYSICCLDECAALMGKIEAHFGAPAASPSAIASFMSTLLPGPPQRRNNTLAPGLLKELESVAMHNGGMVPLHSEHFAHWMHKVYPRECTHPQQARSNRFDVDLRQFVEGYKAEHLAKTPGLTHDPTWTPWNSSQTMHEQFVIKSYEQRQSSTISHEMFMTCVMGVVGAALATLFRKSIKRESGKTL